MTPSKLETATLDTCIQSGCYLLLNHEIYRSHILIPRILGATGLIHREALFS